MRHRSIAVAVQLILILVLAGAVSVGGAAWAGTDSGGGAVYAMTNDAAGNEVVVYHRKQNGSLMLVGAVGTGGLGTGAGLGSQGALILSPDTRWLFAVNAGSDDITGFRVNRSGLSPLPGSTRPLSGTGTGGAQVEFSPAGDLLVVTEKATNIIDMYTVGEDGLPAGPQTHPSEGQTPFGFAFRRRHLIVSEAFGGAPGASALSSYFAARSGDLTPISSSVPDGQTAACWVVIAKDRFAYITNTGSNNMSSYTIDRHGELTLLDPVAGVTGGAPTDAALSRGDRFLYALNSMDGTTTGFRVRANGSLAGPVTLVGGLPPGSAVGIAAF